MRERDGIIKPFAEKIECLQAENERLRKALEEIANHWDDEYRFWYFGSSNRKQAFVIARAALDGAEGGDGE